MSVKFSPDIEEMIERKQQAEHVPNAGELAAWKTRLEREAQTLEAMSQHFKVRAVDLREKVRAAEVLLSERGDDSVTAASAESVVTSKSNGTDPTFTPVDAYWPKILSSLVELGGRGTREEVTERVGKKLESILTPADRELLPSGLDIRWKNRVAWQRLNMIKRGLLRADSPRGTWEITESGRKWLEDFNKGPQQ